MSGRSYPHGYHRIFNSAPWTGRLAVTHNGIVENFAELRDWLLRRGQVKLSIPRTPAQGLAIPAYFYPYPHDRDWNLIHAAGPAIGLLVADPDNGPGSRCDPNYVTAIEATRRQGTLVVGYVTSRYGDSPLDLVIDDIARWYTTYTIDGIFLDEVGTSASHLSDCQAVHARVKELTRGSGLVVLNPGTVGPVDYMSACDILVNNESTWTTYRDASFWLPDWVARYPAQRFWHLVHDCPSERDMRTALWLARSRNAGWVFVTDRTGANAYDRLPHETYWTSLLRRDQAERSVDPPRDRAAIS